MTLSDGANTDNRFLLGSAIARQCGGVWLDYERHVEAALEEIRRQDAENDELAELRDEIADLEGRCAAYSAAIDKIADANETGEGLQDAISAAEALQ